MSDNISPNKIPALVDNIHFKLDVVTETGFKAVCQLCPSDKQKTVSCNSGINSNLLRHLKVYHSEAHEAYKEAKERKRQLDCQALPVTKKLCTREDVTKTIANFVIESSQPISVVEHPAFKTLVSVLSGIVWPQNIVGNIIDSHVSLGQSLLKNIN